MERYTSKSRYRYLGLSVSFTNITLQCCLLYRVWSLSIGGGRQLLALLAAYILADFINGCVHMYMDNNDHYDSPVGPLIANFHLHHKIPQYRKNNLLVVYFMESGSKLWLVVYLLLVAFLQQVVQVDPTVIFTLVYIGIFSSIAEVSHYLCHTSTSSVAGFLASCGLLLSKRHHARHHLQDNAHYAFLNGFTDPLLNLVAGVCYKGYKQNSDLHYAGYVAVDTGTR